MRSHGQAGDGLGNNGGAFRVIARQEKKLVTGLRNSIPVARVNLLRSAAARNRPAPKNVAGGKKITEGWPMSLTTLGDSKSPLRTKF